IKVARQVVQERLAAAQSSLPEDVRPQMGPTSSILGQVMQVGLYRRQGPDDGELTPVGKTGLLGELTHAAAAGSVTLRLWTPVERNRPEAWEPAAADAVPVPLVRSEAGAAPPLILRPGPDHTFTATDPGLKATEDGPRFTDSDRRLTVYLGGKPEEVVFLSARPQQLELRSTADCGVP